MTLPIRQSIALLVDRSADEFDVFLVEVGNNLFAECQHFGGGSTDVIGLTLPQEKQRIGIIILAVLENGTEWQGSLRLVRCLRTWKWCCG